MQHRCQWSDDRAEVTSALRYPMPPPAYLSVSHKAATEVADGLVLKDQDQDFIQQRITFAAVNTADEEATSCFGPPRLPMDSEKFQSSHILSDKLRRQANSRLTAPKNPPENPKCKLPALSCVRRHHGRASSRACSRKMLEKKTYKPV